MSEDDNATKAEVADADANADANADKGTHDAAARGDAHGNHGNHGGHEDAAPVMSACGLGGCLVLYPNYLEIQHFGVLYILVEFLSFHIPRLNVKILRNQITAIEVVRPLLLPDYLVISYAGAPDVRGGYLRRAFAPNALMMRYLENRDFFTILERFGHGLH